MMNATRSGTAIKRRSAGSRHFIVRLPRVSISHCQGADGAHYGADDRRHHSATGHEEVVVASHAQNRHHTDDMLSFVSFHLIKASTLRYARHLPHIFRAWRGEHAYAYGFPRRPSYIGCHKHAVCRSARREPILRQRDCFIRPPKRE